MKKIFIGILAALMTMALFSMGALADEKTLEMNAFVTISDENGAFVLTKAEVCVSDADGDGVLTVNDALIAAHDAYNQGGYATDDPYGDPVITRLWGNESGAYGCFNNGGKVWRLTEYLAEGDHVQAYIYADAERMTDMFSYFSKENLTFENGKEALTLYAYTLTEEGNLLSKPLAGAFITVNGEKTGIKTDKNGKFTITADDLLENEMNIISAYSEKQTIVPPILTVDTAAIESKTPATNPLWYLIPIVIALTAIVFSAQVILKRAKR